MAFFNEIGKKISQTGQSAVQKTKEMADVAKLNSVVTEQEKILNQQYQILGKLFYEKSIEGDNSLTDFSELFDSISKKMAEIKSYNEQIKLIKGIEKCPNCGNDISLEAAFCLHCGTKIERFEKQKCSVCGSEIAEGAAFCTNCGKRISETISSQKVETSISTKFKEIENEKNNADCKTEIEILDVENAEEKIVYCAECGATIEDGALFCTSCGTKIEEE